MNCAKASVSVLSGKLGALFLLLVIGMCTAQARQIERTQEETLEVLDSMMQLIFKYNYYDSLNNEPSFYTFPHVVKGISKKAEKAGHLNAYYQAEQLRMLFYKYNGVSNKVYEILDSTATRAMQEGDTIVHARFVYLKGGEYSRNNQYDKAITLFDSAYRWGKILGSMSLQSTAINAIAVSHTQMLQDEAAITYYHKALELNAPKQDTSNIVMILANIGGAYGRLENGDSALYYGTRAYEMAMEKNIRLGIRQSLNVLIMASYLKGSYQKVIDYTDEMYELIEPTRDIGFMTTPYLNRSKSYFALGDFRKAQADVDESLRIATLVDFETGRLKALQWKAELSEKLGDYRGALSFLKQSQQLQDSIQQEEANDKLESLRRDYEIREREGRIKNLEEMNRVNGRKILYRNLSIGAVIVAFLVLGTLMVLMYKRKLEKERYALQEARDQLLRSQLNPHFLFNALSSIQLFLINKGQGKEALEYLSKFAKLMRRILENSRESLVPLEDEVTTLRHYLDLQKIRFDHKFDYSIDISTDSDPSDIMIPPMFAQPFIENSLEHGIAHRSDGMIKIWFSEQGGSLNFRVEDNGIGISRSTRTDREVSHQSLATIITKDRISLLSKQLKKRINFDIRDKRNREEEITGTEVVFELPITYRFS